MAHAPGALPRVDNAPLRDLRRIAPSHAVMASRLLGDLAKNRHGLRSIPEGHAVVLCMTRDGRGTEVIQLWPGGLRFASFLPPRRARYYSCPIDALEGYCKRLPREQRKIFLALDRLQAIGQAMSVGSFRVVKSFETPHGPAWTPGAPLPVVEDEAFHWV